MIHRITHRVARFLALSAMVVAVASAVLVATSTPANAHQTPWGQGNSEARDLVVSLATFSPGDDIAQWFGHTALIVEDRRLNVSRMYNYGMFHFDQDMLVRFALGRLEFWVAATPIPDSYNIYIAEDRDIRLIELNLPEERRLEVAEFLADNVRPENREYLYHHYDDNCSTRVRDVIDLAVDGQFSEAYQDDPARMTLREHTRRHSAHMPPMDWLLMYWMNSSIDEPATVWDEMFLPEELERQVLNFEWEDDDGEVRPLSLREHYVYEAEEREPVPAKAPTHWPWWLLAGAVIGLVGVLIAFGGRRRPGRASRVGYGLYHMVVGLLLGGPGLLLGVMSTMTEHSVTYWNQNLLLGSPLTLVVALLAVFVLRGSLTARQWLVKLWTALAALALVGIGVAIAGQFFPVLYQDTALALAFTVPIVAGATASTWLVDGRLAKEECTGEETVDVGSD